MTTGVDAARAALAVREEPTSPMDETCLCRHPPEGMIGWDRGMVNRDCPLHGHEALPERSDAQVEQIVEAMYPGGEQEAWEDWYPKSPPSKRDTHRHGFNAGQAAGLIEGEAAVREIPPDSLMDFPEESLEALRDLVMPLEELPQSDRLLRMIDKALEVKRRS